MLLKSPVLGLLARHYKQSSLCQVETNLLVIEKQNFCSLFVVPTTAAITTKINSAGCHGKTPYIALTTILNSKHPQKYCERQYRSHTHYSLNDIHLLKFSKNCSLNKLRSFGTGDYFLSDKPPPTESADELASQVVNKSSSPDQESVKGSLPSDPLGVPASVSVRLKDAVIKKVLPRPKEKSNSLVSTARNFITPVRAMTEFQLEPGHLKDLRKTKRRSPFENEPRITVYWMKDVENKAIEVWGSLELLEKEKKKRLDGLERHKQNLFNMRRLLLELKANGDVTGAAELERANKKEEPKSGLDASSRVVYAAVVINGVNFILKLGAWMYTGSACLFAEALHSLADTTNQLILAYGIHKSMQRADTEHPYGYSNMRHVSSLLSGAMIFCVGAGLSVQHGILGIMNPPEVVPLFWAFCILGGSLVTEGGTLVMAVHAIRQGALKSNMTFMQYVMKSEDPSVNVVLLEDAAAVLGVGVALSCLGLTSLLGTTLPDALGSCVIGGILGAVALFIIRSNVAALVGRSIPQQQLERMTRILEQDVMVREMHDVKGIDMGRGLVRYKAELDFDGRELTRAYLDKQDLDVMLQELQKLQSPEEVQTFMLNFGENVVDTMGAEIDRIEQTLRKAHPEVRHCDLEIL